MSKGIGSELNHNDTQKGKTSQEVQKSQMQANAKEWKVSSLFQMGLRNKSTLMHLSNNRSFSRISPQDANASKIKQMKQQQQQKRFCLRTAKTALNLIHCLKSSDKSLLKCFFISRFKKGIYNNFAQLSQLSAKLKHLKHTIIIAINDFLHNLTNLVDFTEDCVSDLINDILPSKQLIILCGRIQKSFHILSKQLVQLRCKLNEPLLTVCVSFCSQSIKKLTDLISTLNSFINQNCSASKAKIEKYTADLGFFVKKLAEQRSHILSKQLSSATIESIKSFITEYNSNEDISLHKLIIPIDKLKNVVKILKRIFRNILQNENIFIETIMKDIEDINKEVLTKNNDILFMKHKKTNNSAKFIHFDSIIGPNQKAILISQYSDVLWTQIKYRLSQHYIMCMFEEPVLPCRLANRWLISFEIELISEIHSKLHENGMFLYSLLFEQFLFQHKLVFLLLFLSILLNTVVQLFRLFLND